MQSTLFRFQRCRAVAASLAVFLASNAVVYAYPGGVTGYSGASGPTCGSCHGGATAPALTLTGPTTLGVGATGNYTLSLQRSGGNASGGLDVSVNGGTLTTSTANTTVRSGEITHSTPLSVPAAGANWTFSWQAPGSPGNYTIYGAAASTNGAGTSGDGTAASTLAVTVTAVNQPPIARISGSTTAVAGSAVTFGGSGSTDPDGSIVAYDWNFGDGSAGAGASVTHVYAAGTYTVTLTVTDNAGATNSATQTITVTPASQPQPPVANPAGPYNGTVGSVVQFNGSGSTDPDGSIVSYNWNFGDGAIANTVSPAHAYSAPGTYTVTLTVTDNSGLTGSAQTTATIVAAPTPPPATDGEALYNSYCASCHGPAGRGGSAGSVVGESAGDITEAIAEVPTMRSLGQVLSAEQINAIAAYLNGGQAKPPRKKCGDGARRKDNRECGSTRPRERD